MDRRLFRRQGLHRDPVKLVCWLFRRTGREQANQAGLRHQHDTLVENPIVASWVTGSLETMRTAVRTGTTNRAESTYPRGQGHVLGEPHRKGYLRRA